MDTADLATCPHCLCVTRKEDLAEHIGRRCTEAQLDAIGDRIMEAIRADHDG